MTIGVLLMAYGGPGNLDEVEGYYTDIRGGRAPTPEALEELKERYARIGGRSPLLEISRRQADRLEEVLNSRGPDEFRTYVGMKHWHPYIGEAVEQAARDRVGILIGLALAPHYSKMSIGGYEERLLKTREATGADFEVRMIRSWYAEPSFVDFVAGNVKKTLADWAPEAARVFFTAHSLPERAVAEGDPYMEELLSSSKLIADAAGVPDWEFAFQSASATGEPWLGPDILERLGAFAGRAGTRALIAPVGFVADHLEILFDVDVKCAERCRELGLEFRRIPSPNDDLQFIEALAAVVRRRL